MYGNDFVQNENCCTVTWAVQVSTINMNWYLSLDSEGGSDLIMH